MATGQRSQTAPEQTENKCNIEEHRVAKMSIFDKTTGIAYLVIPNTSSLKSKSSNNLAELCKLSTDFYQRKSTILTHPKRRRHASLEMAVLESGRGSGAEGQLSRGSSARRLAFLSDPMPLRAASCRAVRGGFVRSVGGRGWRSAKVTLTFENRILFYADDILL